MPALLHNYDVLEILGSGSFGTCYKVQHITSKDVFVWKAVDYTAMGEKTKEMLSSEVTLLSEIRNPQIVRYYSRIIHPQTSTLYIIMEWCDGGDLASVLEKFKQEGQQFGDQSVWHFVANISRALDWLHTHAILHGNIKPSNIFVQSNSKYKLGDLSLAARRHAVHCGVIQESPFYQSPEILKGGTVEPKSDVWALGCVAFQMCSLSLPFCGKTAQEVLVDIQKKRNISGNLNRTASLVRIISWMLSIDNRPVASAVARHPSVVAVTSDAEIKVTPNISKASSSNSNNEVSETLGNIKPQVSTADVHRRPEEISYGLFRTKWVRRIEDVRGREARAAEREKALSEREQRVASLERRVASLEKRSRRSRSVPRSRPKIPIEDEVSYCVAPGDSSFSQPTAARLDPTTIARPNFPPRVRFKSDSGIDSGRDSKFSDGETKFSGCDTKLPHDRSKIQVKVDRLDKNCCDKTKIQPVKHLSKLKAEVNFKHSKKFTFFQRESECKLLPKVNINDKLKTLQPAAPSYLKQEKHSPTMSKTKLTKTPGQKSSRMNLFTKGLRLYKRKNKGKRSNEVQNCSDKHSSEVVKSERESTVVKESRIPNFLENQNDLTKLNIKTSKRCNCTNKSTISIWEDQHKSTLDESHFRSVDTNGAEHCVRNSKGFLRNTEGKLSNRLNIKNESKAHRKSSNFKLPPEQCERLRVFHTETKKFVSLDELCQNSRKECHRKSLCVSEPTTNPISTYFEFSGDIDDNHCHVGGTAPQIGENEATVRDIKMPDDELSGTLFRVVNLR